MRHSAWYMSVTWTLLMGGLAFAHSGSDEQSSPDNTAQTQRAGPLRQELPGRPSLSDLLPKRAQGTRFVILTDSELPIVEIVALADRAYDQIADWLELPPEADLTALVPIYLCMDVATIYEVEKRYNQWPSNRVKRSFEFQGGFYPENMFIALPADHFRELDRVVMHELTHLALSRIIEGPPDIINEGLAELLPSMILDLKGDAQSGSYFSDLYHLPRCEKGLQAGKVLRLSSLFHLSYWGFRDEKYGGLNYSLGWHLVRFLTESEHEAIAGKFPDFLRRLSGGRPAWRAFRITYDASLVERLWHAELARSIPWQPAFGAWRTSVGGFETIREQPGSAILICDKQPSSDHDWELSYAITKDALATPGIGQGFVVGYRGQQEFSTISIRPIFGDISYAKFHDGKWQTISLKVLAPESLREGRLRLTVLRDGSLRVRLDADLLANFPAAADVHNGSAGLMFELHPMGASAAPATYEFRDVRQQRGKPPRKR